jgi:tetratricopeptide (TPR) repeat protein
LNDRDLSQKRTSVALRSLAIQTGIGRTIALGAAACVVVCTTFVVIWGFANTASLDADTPEIGEFLASAAPADPQTQFVAAALLENTFEPADVEKALRHYELAVAASPHNYLLWMQLGKARDRSGDSEGAEVALRKALSLAPHYSSVHWTLGNAMIRHGRIEEGFEEVRKAVSGDPLLTKNATMTAWQFFDGDIESVRNAIGDSAPLRAELASILAKEGRFDDAVKIWSSLSNPEKRTNLVTTGEAIYGQLLAAKRYSSALQVLSEIRPEEADHGIGKVSNGGFERTVKLQKAGLFEWNIGEGVRPQIGLNDGNKWSGNLSLLMAFGSGSKEFRQVWQTVAVVPGERYEFELFYRAELNSKAQFSWVIVNASDNSELAAVNLKSLTTDWTSERIDFVAPSNSDGIIIRFERFGCETPACSVSGSIWFDDISLSKR